MSATHVAATIPQESHKGQSFPVYLSMPIRIIADRDMGTRTRVLAWLICQGATPLRAVRVHQAVLARELKISARTVRENLHALAKAGYIVAEHNPFTDGRVYSYRLAFSHETTGGVA